jgi:hypothetical protein
MSGIHTPLLAQNLNKDFIIFPGCAIQWTTAMAPAHMWVLEEKQRENVVVLGIGI